jgi:hypothetical protein
MMRGCEVKMGRAFSSDESRAFSVEGSDLESDFKSEEEGWDLAIRMSRYKLQLFTKLFQTIKVSCLKVVSPMHENVRTDYVRKSCLC